MKILDQIKITGAVIMQQQSNRTRTFEIVIESFLDRTDGDFMIKFHHPCFAKLVTIIFAPNLSKSVLFFFFFNSNCY